MKRQHIVNNLVVVLRKEREGCCEKKLKGTTQQELKTMASFLRGVNWFLKGNSLENNRYINQLHWVFDLPRSAEFSFEENAVPRIMMIYERATERMEFEILDREIPDEVREKISSWLRKSDHVWDMINGLA